MKKEKSMKMGLVIGTMLIMVFAGMGIVVYLNEKKPIDVFDEEKDDLEWVEIATVDSKDIPRVPVGEASPAGEGWLATFMLNYSETPGTCLASNASGGGYDSWGNVSGYVDTDDTDTDLPSESGSYYVVRARFDSDVKDGSDFIGGRCRCTLTVSGDETISGVAQVGDSSDTTGGGVVSYNNTGADYIYINFYWDDNSNGYRITDDGSTDWSITLEEKK